MSKQKDIAPRVAKMRAAGMSWRFICKELGVADDTARMSIDPEYAERRRIANNMRRRGQYVPKLTLRSDAPRMSKEDVTRAIDQAIARAKQDRRTGLERVFGDPPYHRSALAQRDREQRGDA